MADASISAQLAALPIERVTVGTTTQRPDTGKLGSRALHFATTTTWGVSTWDSGAWQNVGLLGDPTGNYTQPAFHAAKPVSLTRIQIGTAAQREDYSIGSDPAIHFATATPWAVTYWNGQAWANIALGGDPTGNAAVSSLFQVRKGLMAIYASVAANRPSFWPGAPSNVLHFASDTPYAISLWNGSTWANICLMSAP